VHLLIRGKLYRFTLQARNDLLKVAFTSFLAQLWRILIDSRPIVSSLARVLLSGVSERNATQRCSTAAYHYHSSVRRSLAQPHPLISSPAAAAATQCVTTAALRRNILLYIPYSYRTASTGCKEIRNTRSAPSSHDQSSTSPKHEFRVRLAH